MKTSYILLFTGLLALASCMGGDNAAADAEGGAHAHTADSDVAELTQLQTETVGISLDTLSMREIGEGIEAYGEISIDPQQRALVSVLTPGVVKSIAVTPGQRVARGQVLATVESPDALTLEQEYAAAASEYTLARQELDRQRELAAAGAGVRRNLEIAESAYAVAQARERSLADRLRQLGLDRSSAVSGTVPLRAPIAGIVTTVDASIGSFADMQAPVMTIVDNSGCYAVVNVFEKDLASVSAGQSVELSLTNNPSVKMEGKVSNVSPELDTASRSAAVRVTVDRPVPESLMPGMAVTAAIAVQPRLAEALPTDAIVSAEGHHYVFRADGTETEADGSVSRLFRRCEVVPGARHGGYTAVRFTEPQPAGAQYVVSGAFYLASATTEHAEHSH